MSKVGQQTSNPMPGSLRCENETNVTQTVTEWRRALSSAHSKCDIKLSDDSAFLEIVGEIIDGPKVSDIVNSGWDNALTAICNEGETTVVTIDLDPVIHRILLKIEDCGYSEN